MHWIIGFLAGLVLWAAPAAAQVTVHAAASLQQALEAVGQAARSAGGPTFRFAFAGSNALARQIEQGAPADIFVSADEAWMDYLTERKLIVPESRVRLLTNRLALIGPVGAAPLTLAPGVDLLGRLGGGRLATGDPAAVPVGRYAQAALTTLGLWAAIEPRLARAENVRAAMVLVERGEAPLGIVYTSDVLISSRVVTVGVFPADSHPPITYPIALVAGRDRPETRAALAYLRGPAALEIYTRFGFGPGE